MLEECTLVESMVITLDHPSEGTSFLDIQNDGFKGVGKVGDQRHVGSPKKPSRTTRFPRSVNLGLSGFYFEEWTLQLAS